MSQASQSVTLTRIKNGMNYSGMLSVNKGDLWQKYNGTKVAPDFTVATNQPVVTFSCITGEGEVPSTILVYWDDKVVSFSSLETGSVNGASETLAAGVIQISQKGNPATGAKWQLRFLKNIAVAGTAVLPSHMLKVVGEFPSGNKVTASKGFSLSELIDSSESVHIEPGATDENPFVVNQDVTNSQCTLVAQMYKGGEPVSLTGCTYQWYKQDASATSGWAVVANATQQTLVVKAGDVDSYAMYKVEVTTPSNNKVTDTQSVLDVGDPYEVGITVTDQSGATATPSMNGAVATNESRVFKASLVSRKGGAVPAIKSIYWIVTNVAGVTLNGGTTKIGDMAGSQMNTLKADGTDEGIKISAAWLDQQGLQSVEVTAMVTF